MATNKISEGEFNRSSAMQQKYGTYSNYLKGITVTAGGFSSADTSTKRDSTAVKSDLDKTDKLIADLEAKAKSARMEANGYSSLTTIDRSNLKDGAYDYTAQAVRSQAKADLLENQLRDLRADRELLVKEQKAATKISEGEFNRSSAMQQRYGTYSNYQNNRVTTSSGFYSPTDNMTAEEGAQWLSTVRTPDAIKTDKANTDLLIQQMEERAKTARAAADKAQSVAAGSGFSRLDIKESAANAARLKAQAELLENQLKELKGDRDRLDEETYWGYNKFKTDGNFDKESKYKSNGDKIYETINKNSDAIKSLVTSADVNVAALGLDRADFGINQNPLTMMTDGEVGIYNYLYSTQGKEKADEYIRFMSGDLQKRLRYAEIQSAQQYASQHAVGASLRSVVMSPLKAITAVGQMIDNLDGSINQNAAYNKFATIPTAYRSAVSGVVEKKWGKTGSFLYNTGMSMADFLFNTAIGGGNEKTVLALMGAEAMPETVIEAKNRGLTDSQAMSLGLISGLAEIVTEKVSIEKLFSEEWEENALKYFIKNVIAEGGEEGASDLINTFADILITGDKSEWQTAVNEYKRKDKTDTEAFRAALKDKLFEIGLDVAGGALSGGVMAGGSIEVNNAIQNAVQTEIGKNFTDIDSIQRLVDEGGNLPRAQELQRKIDNNEKITAKDTGKLFADIMTLPTAEKDMLRNRIQRAETETQRTGLESGASDTDIKKAERMSRLFNRDIRFYSQEAENGIVENGKFEDGVLWVNTRAKNPQLQIITHELTHSLEESSEYKGFSEHVLSYLKKSGTYQTMADRIQEIYAKRGITAPEAIDKEVIAKYTQNNLFTSEDDIREAVRARRSIGSWMVSQFDNILAKLGNEDAQERQFLRRARKMYVAALNDTKQLGKDLFSSNAETRSTAAASISSPSTMHNYEYVPDHIEDLQKKYDAKNAETPINEILSVYQEAVRIWGNISAASDSAFLAKWNAKTKDDRAFSIFKAQTGYKYNEELSTMCKKAIPLFEAIDTVVRENVLPRLRTTQISKTEKEILYRILQKHGFEIPCAVCYLEQARQAEGRIIDAFSNGNENKLGWNEALDKIEERMQGYKFPDMSRSIATDNYTPANTQMDEQTYSAFIKAFTEVANEELRKANRAEIKESTPEAILSAFKGAIPNNLQIFKTMATEPESRVRIDPDLLYSSQTTHNLAKSHGALYSLFNRQGGVSGYKLKQTPVVYWGDYLDKKWKPSTVRKNGAIRTQSNSDYMMYQFMDYVQKYVDLTAKGYYQQAYTKVLSELKLFGKTGAKFNASAIPMIRIIRNADGSINAAATMENAGLDENGNPIYDDVEGINHEEAFMLASDPEYSKNVCVICIGFSDNHIRKLLDDDNIQMIIGYHDKTNNPEKRYPLARYAKNYRGQNEAQKNGQTVSVNFNRFIDEAEKMFGKRETVNFNDKTYTYNDIPKLAADRYLAYCQSNDMTPAYNIEGIVDHPNYYKLLADFGLYDSNGNYAPMNKVKVSIPSEIPYLENGEKRYVKTDEYIAKELAAENKIRDDISAALAENGEDSIISEFIREVNAQRKVEQGTQFSLSEDSEYMELAKDPEQNRDRLQTMVDEAAKKAGYNKRLLHGTSKEFNSFVASGSKTEAKSATMGIWLSDSARTATAYSTPQETDYTGDNSHTWDRISSKADSIMEGIKDDVFSEKETFETKNFLFQNNYWNLASLGEAFKKYCPADYEELRDIGVFTDNEKFVKLTKSTYNSTEENRKAWNDVIDRVGRLREWYNEIYDARMHPANLSKSILNILDMGVVRSLASGEVAPRIMDVYVNTSNFAEAKPPYNLDEEKTSRIKSAKRRGKDGIIFYGMRDGGEKSNHYVVFNTENIKSANPVTYDDNGNVIPLSERFNINRNDIRYDLEYSDEDMDRTGYEGYDSLWDYLIESGQVEEDIPAETPIDMVNTVDEVADIFTPSAHTEDTEGETSDTATPITARKDLRDRLIKTFSIPSQGRNEINEVINAYADAIYEDGYISDGDMNALFDILYDAGRVNVTDDEYAEVRKQLKGTKIYVSNDIKTELGDNWQDLLKKAFGAGLYLTNSNTDIPLDIEWQELSKQFPGYFDAANTDLTMMLNTIIDIMDAGKTRGVPHREYAEDMYRRTGVSEEDYIRDLRNDIEEAIAEFKPAAKIESRLREQSGITSSLDRKRRKIEKQKAAEEAANRAREIDRTLAADKLQRPPIETKNRETDITDEVFRQWQNQADQILTDSDEYAKDLAQSKITDEATQEKKTLKEKYNEAKSFFMRKFVDSGDAVREIGRETKDAALYSYYNMARASTSTATSMITDKATDIYGRVTGKGLTEIFKPIRDKGADYYRAFQEYLYHLHNIDRMSRDRAGEAEAVQREIDTFLRDNPQYLNMTEKRIRDLAYGIDQDAGAQDYLNLINKYNRKLNAVNKPVFGWEVTADKSKTLTQMLEVKHPEFVELRDQVYAYIDNLLRYRVDSGLISQKDYEALKKAYPHYVPTYRVMADDIQQRSTDNVTIGRTIGKASGSSEKLMPLHKALAEQTRSVVREGSKNRFGIRLLNKSSEDTKIAPESVENLTEKEKKADEKILKKYEERVAKEEEKQKAKEEKRKAKEEKQENKESSHIKGLAEFLNEFDEDTFDSDIGIKKTNTFVVRDNGKMYELKVDAALFEAVKALSPDKEETNALLKFARGSNNLFKELVTGYDPTFVVRNFARDLQDAGLYSRDSVEFAKHYPKAVKEITSNGRYWQRYKALGGVYSSMFNYETGNLEEGGAIKKNVVNRIAALNEGVEQAPRLAEFMAIVDKAGGLSNASMDTLMDAMMAAADVTVNFGRSGSWSKFINTYLVPFWNPGIQGFDKMVRTVTETKGAKEWMKLITKAALLGIAPTVVNAMIYGDDDDWNELSDRNKDTYYLFKIGDGAWIKIPKGRVLSVFGGLTSRGIELARGEEVNWRDFVEFVGSQTAPADPFNNNIFAAAIKTQLFDPDDPGETWYGSDIEAQRLRNYAPENRYDAQTDEVSKFLGRVFKLSPKKINYLLEQYTGVAGRVVLPWLTPAAEKGLFSSAFTINSTQSNRLSGDFYDKLDELTYAKNDVNATEADEAIYKWWNKQNTEISKVNKVIREIEADTTISNAEKRELLNVQYKMRNAIERQALDDYDEYATAVKIHYAQTGDGDKAYNLANRDVYGAEYALQIYKPDKYEDAQMLYSKGVSYDESLDIYMQIGDINNPKNIDKYKVVTESTLSTSKQMAFLETMMEDTEYTKVSTGYDSGITPAKYVAMKEKLDGSPSQPEVKEALLSIPGLTNDERAMLWQMASGNALNKNAWAAKNNPFSTSVGAAMRAKLQAAGASRTTEEDSNDRDFSFLTQPGDRDFSFLGGSQTNTSGDRDFSFLGGSQSTSGDRDFSFLSGSQSTSGDRDFSFLLPR